MGCLLKGNFLRTSRLSGLTLFSLFFFVLSAVKKIGKLLNENVSLFFQDAFYGMTILEQEK